MDTGSIDRWSRRLAHRGAPPVARATGAARPATRASAGHPIALPTHAPAVAPAAGDACTGCNPGTFCIGGERCVVNACPDCFGLAFVDADGQALRGGPASWVTSAAGEPIGCGATADCSAACPPGRACVCADHECWGGFPTGRALGVCAVVD